MDSIITKCNKTLVGVILPQKFCKPYATDIIDFSSTNNIESLHSSVNKATTKTEVRQGKSGRGNVVSSLGSRSAGLNRLKIRGKLSCSEVETPLNETS